LALLLRHNYIPGPYSIFKNIFKLNPGYILTLTLDTFESSLAPYWSAREIAEQGQANLFRGSDGAATAELDRLLRQSIAGQMIADVPLGVFLSGGIDSSLIAALMQAQSSQPIKTYTMGFHVEGYNEAGYAKAVAQHLKTDHTEMYVTPNEALAVISRLPTLYDEPFADSSQIPTFLVSQLARQHVTVILSGDGGDELFGGYPRYAWSDKLWRTFGWAPVGLRRLAATSLVAATPLLRGEIFDNLANALIGNIRRGSMGNRLQQVADVLRADRPESLYRQIISYWKEPTQLVLGSKPLPTLLMKDDDWVQARDFIHRMMYLDLVMYLPDDILVKVDRASMGVSLETRAPYLDHRVMEFAWTLPLSMKIRHQQSKWLMKQVLYQYVPEALIARPKMGFGVPMELWLRRELRDWAEDLLDEKRLREEGFVDPKPIRQKWAEHLSGDFHWQYFLWGILMFQAWKREWGAA
jgi:asparagine synthase (glutamine-hydrolysing)